MFEILAVLGFSCWFVYGIVYPHKFTNITNKKYAPVLRIVAIFGFLMTMFMLLLIFVDA
jgi:hypothetical protein